MSDIGGAKRTAEDGIDGEAELHAAKRKREQDAEEQENSDAEAASDDDDDLFDESDGSDEDLFDDEDDVAAAAEDSSKPAAAASGTVLDAADSDSDSDSDSIASFDDGYGSGFMGDEEDQTRLNAMSELEREAEIEERRRQREAGRNLVAYRREKQQRARKLKGKSTQAAAAAASSDSESDGSYRGGGRRRLRAKSRRQAAADDSSGSEEEAEWDRTVQKREKAKQRALKRKKAAYTDMKLDSLDAEYEAAFAEGGVGGAAGGGAVDTELEAELLAELGEDEDISDTEATRRADAAKAAAEELTPGVLWKYGLLTRAWLTRHVGWDYFKDAIPGLFVRFSVPSSAAARGFKSPSGRVLGIITRVVRGAQYTVKLEAGPNAAGTQFISTRRLEVWAPQVNARPMPLKVTDVSGPVGLHAKYKYAPAEVQQAKQVAVLRAELKAWGEGMKAASQELPTGADVRQRRRALASTTRAHTPSANELSRSARAHRLGVDVSKALHLTNLHETLHNDTLKLREMLKEEHGVDVPDGMVMPLSKGHGLSEAAAALHTELRLLSNKLQQVKAEQERRREAARAQVAVLNKINRDTAKRNRRSMEEVIRRQQVLARNKEYRAVQANDPTIRKESAPVRMWHTGPVESLREALKAKKEAKKAQEEAAAAAKQAGGAAAEGTAAKDDTLPEEAQGLGLGSGAAQTAQRKTITAVQAEAELLAKVGRGGSRPGTAPLTGGSVVDQVLASTEQELDGLGLSLRTQRTAAGAGAPLGAKPQRAAPAGSSGGGRPLSFAQLKAKRAAAQAT